MNTRIKKIRKKNKLNQEEFGKRIGIGKTSVSKLESGENNPSEQTIILICSEFNIDEHWLRTGEGTSDRKLTPSEEIEKIVRNLLDYSKDSKKNPLYDMIIEMMKDYNELDPDSQAVIKNYCSKVQAGLAHNQEASEQTTTYQKDRSYLRPVAAHERTDIEVTDEMRQSDDELVKKLIQNK